MESKKYEMAFDVPRDDPDIRGLVVTRRVHVAVEGEPVAGLVEFVGWVAMETGEIMGGEPVSLVMLGPVRLGSRTLQDAKEEFGRHVRSIALWLNVAGAGLTAGSGLKGE